MHDGEQEHYKLLAYLRLVKEPGQEGPQGQSSEAQSQHGAMEETHHLGAAKTNNHSGQTVNPH